MVNVSYKDLKSNIIKALKQISPDSMQFSVCIDKLADLTEDMSLLPLNVGLDSSQIMADQVPYISEYFQNSKLSWIDNSKFSTVLIFIDTTSLNKTALDLIEELKSEDPTIDRTGIVSNLVANYPCWFATIVSYQSNNPKYLGKPSYEIKCRANKVVITNSDYQYNPNDFA
jgi:hypothetical protein